MHILHPEHIAALLLPVLLLFGAAPAWAQLYRLTPPDTIRSHSFGASVALDGDLALVGASGANACDENSGAVYVFERDTVGRWRRTARLTPHDCRGGAFFGRALSLSNGRALIGASVEFFADEQSNVAYVFERDATGTWRETARLTVDPRPIEGVFAAAVDLDGDRALITTRTDPGTPGGGAAYLFERRADGTWRRAARLTPRALPAGGHFGDAGALDGRRAVVAASTYFADEPGALYVFERDTADAWHQVDRLGGIDAFFTSVALDGDHLLAGEGRTGRRLTGAATLFARTPSGRWRRAATFRPEAPYAHGAFGMAVALDGNTALVTGYDEQLGLEINIDRVVYVFERDPASGAWYQKQIIDMGTVDFATSVALNGGTALIGYVSNDGPGAAYVVPLW